MSISISHGTLTQVESTLSPASGYDLPTTVTVSGATSSYNSTSGQLTLTSLTSSMSVTATGTAPTTVKKKLRFNNKIVNKVNNKYVDHFNGNLIQTAIAQTPTIDSYLTFSSPSSFTLSTYNNLKNWDGTLEYSTDATTWNTWSGTSAISSSSSGDAKYLYLRGSNNTYITGNNGTNTRWVLTGSTISCNGNIENLLDYATVALGNHPTMARYTFANLFRENANLISAPNLPATTLSERSYTSMFYKCTALTTAPELPATTLAQSCYTSMFQGCTSLINAPELPATTLAQGCYQQMFWGCTLLISAPELPATTLESSCYYYMFYNCTALISAPILPATTLVANCYQQMFQGCTSLTTPAKMAGGTTQATPASSCCYNMYYNCTSLNIYTSSSGHTAFYKALTYSTSSSATDYQSTYRMFYLCKIDGTASTTNYLTAGTQYYY